MRYNIIFILTLLLSNCGVSSDSSGVPENFDDTPDNNISDPDDGNVTDPTDPDDGNTTDPTEPITDPVFDPDDGAIYDPIACASSYAIDTPLQDDSLSDRETDDVVNAISLQSLLPVTLDKDDSNIILYYKALSIKPTYEVTNAYGLNGEYIVMYDLAWVQEPNNTIYAEVPQTDNELKSCFKMTLNRENGSEITPVKVYR